MFANPLSRGKMREKKCSDEYSVFVDPVTYHDSVSTRCKDKRGVVEPRVQGHFDAGTTSVYGKCLEIIASSTRTALALDPPIGDNIV